MSEEKQVLAGVPGPGNTEPEVAPEGKCPVAHGGRADVAGWAPTNADWWPNQLNLKVCTRILLCPIPWTRNLITQKNSRAST